jgi:hypothetical protein
MNMRTLALVKHDVGCEDANGVRVNTVMVRAMKKMKRIVVLAEEIKGKKLRAMDDASGSRSRIART